MRSSFGILNDGVSRRLTGRILPAGSGGSRREEGGDGAGYDILSFEATGEERLLEVKTTNGGARTPFFLSRNECRLAVERPEQWRIYRVHLFAMDPRVFTIVPPVEGWVNLVPEVWRASF